MAHRIAVVKVDGIAGPPLRVPELDSAAQPVADKDGRVKLKEADTLDLLSHFVMSFPRDKLSLKSIMEANLLYAAITKSRADSKLAISLPDSTFKWLETVLKDEQIGVPIFGLNLLVILKSLGMSTDIPLKEAQ